MTGRVFISFLVFSLWLQFAAADERGSLPQVLLASPVNLTWAANQGSYWQERGIDGFLLRGVVDDLAGSDDGTAEGEVQASSQALLDELRFARVRLEEAGVSRFFVHVRFAPEGDWFSGREERSRVASALGNAGALCARTALTGLALDLRGHPELFFPQWDGYPSVAYEELASSAREASRRALHAFYRACPDGEVLVLCPALDTAGPLLFDVLDGVVESVGAAATLRQHLIFEQDTARGTAAQRKCLDQWLGDRFRARLEGDWRQATRKGFWVLPLLRDAGGVLARMGADAFAERKAFLQLFSDDYVVVDDPDGAWWSVAEGHVAQYAGLLQAGEAAVRARGPLPAWLDAWTCRLPFSGFTRVGTLDSVAGEALVLRSELGASAFFPHGTATEIRIDNRVQPVYVSRASKGFSRRDIAPARDGEVALPRFREPVFVDGLPVGDWLLPAGMSFSVATPFRARGLGLSGRASGLDAVRTQARFGLRNDSPVEMTGLFQAVAAPGYGLGEARFDLTLPPGGAAQFERYVQGVPHLGEAASFDLLWVTPEGSETVRRFTFPVRPALVTTIETQGPARFRPLVSGDQVVVGSSFGDVQGVAPGSGMVWRYEHRSPNVVGLVRCSIAGGDVGVALLDRGGRIRMLDGTGRAVGSVRVPEVEVAEAFAEDGTGGFVVVNPLGDVIRVGRDGHVTWRAEGSFEAGVEVGAAGLLALPEGGWLAHVGGMGGGVVALSDSGAVVWRRALALLAPPVLTGAGKATVLVGMEDGQVLRIRREDGRLSGVLGSVQGAIRWLVPLPGGDVLLGTDEKVTRMNPLGAIVWAVDAARPGRPALWWTGEEGMLLFGTSPGRYRGGVTCRALGDGALWWGHEAYPAPVSDGVAWVDAAGDGRPEAVVCGWDRVVRVYDLDDAWRARADGSAR